MLKQTVSNQLNYLLQLSNCPCEYGWRRRRHNLILLVSWCHFSYFLIKKLRKKWLRLLRDGCKTGCTPWSRVLAIQNLLSKWRGGNLLFEVQHWSLFPVGTRTTEYTDANPKSTVQCMVGNNWCCWLCWGKDELEGGGQGARDGQLITSPMWLVVTKKRQLQHWMHRLEFSTWGSPSALLGTGKAPSEVPDLVWGPVLQERHGPLRESPEDTGEHGRSSRNHPYKESFRTKYWRKRENMIPNTVQIPRRPPRGG